MSVMKNAIADFCAIALQHFTSDRLTRMYPEPHHRIAISYGLACASLGSQESVDSVATGHSTSFSSSPIFLSVCFSEFRALALLSSRLRSVTIPTETKR